LPRHASGLYRRHVAGECVQHYKAAFDAGLLKIMSKMGISVISSYRGGYNFEALGLSRALVAEYLPGVTSRISGIGLAGLEETRSAARHGLRRGRRLAARGRVLPPARKGEPHAWMAT
jgi:glutamate synthase (NADPH/NADH) large chain